MECDLKRKRYIEKDGSELKVTPYKDGTGYKYNYYDRSTYGNTKHNSKHVQAESDGTWKCTENDRDKGTQAKTSGSGCYLTSACMSYYLTNFDDNCYELTILRWFKDNFVSKEDIKHYCKTAPIIVEAIEQEEHKDIIYNYIYDNVVGYCVEQIENGNYIEAYTESVKKD